MLGSEAIEKGELGAWVKVSSSTALSSASVPKTLFPALVSRKEISPPGPANSEPMPVTVPVSV